MSAVTIKAELSTPITAFLERKGYSHLLCSGEDKKSSLPDSEPVDYLLVPLKATDSRIGYEETDQLILPIQSPDVTDMAAGIDAVRFLIEIPVSDYEEYLSSAK